MKQKKPKRTATSYEREIEGWKAKLVSERETSEAHHRAAENELHTQRRKIDELTKDLAVAKGSESSLRLKLTKAREELDKLLNLPREELKRVQVFQEVGQAMEILGLVRARLNGEDHPRPAPKPPIP